MLRWTKPVLSASACAVLPYCLVLVPAVDLFLVSGHSKLARACCTPGVGLWSAFMLENSPVWSWPSLKQGHAALIFHFSTSLLGHFLQSCLLVSQLSVCSVASGFFCQLQDLSYRPSWNSCQPNFLYNWSLLKKQLTFLHRAACLIVERNWVRDSPVVNTCWLFPVTFLSLMQVEMSSRKTFPIILPGTEVRLTGL